ncbi:MAG: DUF6318 family protein [Actinomycetaceae bacterium]
MQRNIRPRVLVPAAAFAAVLLSACVDDPVPPAAAPTDQAPGSTPGEGATGPAPTDDAPAASSGGVRADDPATTSVDDVQWTDWELLRRNAEAPVPADEFYAHDETGASAALDHILAVEVYTYNTLDLDAWRAISADACSSCASLAEEREGWAIQGTYDENYLFNEQSREIVQEGDEPNWTFVATGVEPARMIVDSQGGVVEELAEAAVEFLYDVSWTGDGWQIEEFRIDVL